MKKFGLVLVLALAAACAGLAGETFVRAVSTGAYREWTHTGGGVLRLKGVLSGATGGVLRVKHDLMIGGATGAATRDVALIVQKACETGPQGGCGGAEQLVETDPR